MAALSARPRVPPQHHGGARVRAGQIRELHRTAAPRHQPDADQLRVRAHRGLSGQPAVMVYQKINFSAAGGIATIELNDPPATTYSYERMRELDSAVLTSRMDPDVHVIILRGAGERFFCAGANIAMLSNADPEFKYYFCLHANETLTRLEQTPKLVIAALNGHTVGGGLEVALAADIRIARKDAGKIGLPEVALGVLPGTGGTQRLARLVGKARAIELMATGRLTSFDE